MLEKWETPRVTIQEFEPNEYVAVCWGVSCMTDKANGVEWNFYHNPNPIEAGVTHDNAYCGQRTHQWLVDSDNNNIAESMIEINTNGLDDLPCTIYTGPDYTEIRNISTVKSGDHIFWTTSSGNRTWHHQGTVTDTVPGHPNRS